MVWQKILEEKVGYYREHDQVGKSCHVYEATSDDDVRGLYELIFEVMNL